MNVDLVHVYTEDGVRLDGVVHRPTAAPATWLPADIVICFHGVGGNFYSPYVFEPMAERLVAEGCTVLRTNNRGHDVIFNPVAAPNLSYDQVTASREANNRLGAAFEIVDDCVKDIQAWIAFALSEGFQRIALWGHSLGGVKTLYYLANQPDGHVSCAIVSSPPRFSHEMNLRVATSAEFQQNLARARRLVDAGTPNELLTVKVPNANAFTARTFVDKYGPADSYDIMRQLPNVRLPTLITLGGEETSPSFTDLMAGGDDLTARHSVLSYRLIDGADHFYRDRLDELWDAVSDWMRHASAVTAN